MTVDEWSRTGWGRDVHLAMLAPGAGAFLHEGVEPAPTHPRDGGEAYISGSWVPGPDHRALTSRELNLLAEANAPEHASLLAVLRAPGPLLQYISAHAGQVWRNDPSLWVSPEGRDLLSPFLEQAGFTSTALPRCIGVARRTSGLRSTAWDPRNGLRTGLHIDSWDGNTLSGRAGSRNRLCLNMGPAARDLFVLPMHPARLARHFLPDLNIDAAPPSDIVGALFGSAPHIGILRLRIPPGFAYIAATDTFIHDGASDVSAGEDLSLTWLGRFGPADPEGSPWRDREPGRPWPLPEVDT